MISVAHPLPENLEMVCECVLQLHSCHQQASLCDSCASKTHFTTKHLKIRLDDVEKAVTFCCLWLNCGTSDSYMSRSFALEDDQAKIDQAKIQICTQACKLKNLR